MFADDLPGSWPVRPFEVYRDPILNDPVFLQRMRKSSLKTKPEQKKQCGVADPLGDSETCKGLQGILYAGKVVTASFDGGHHGHIWYIYIYIYTHISWW